MNRPPLERILSHVVKHEGTGHWEWVGGCRTGKYGEYGGTRLNGKMMSSHRAVWILLKGYVPSDLLHQCGMTLCCNPKHLKEGTKSENSKEAVAIRGGKGWGSCAGGERHASRKLSMAKEEEIYKRCMSGESQSKLAKEHGVTQACISLLMKRIRRKNDS